MGTRAIKQRADIIASSLASYFGVGFNDIDTQFDLDLGLIPNEFDDAAEDRMRLGRNLEDGVLDYFEERMGIKIDERNSETKFAVDGLLKCKRDGRTYLDGVETGWEGKYSNAQSDFTLSKAYELQCQAYMMAWGLDQWVLAGIWQGKPVFRLIKADPEVQKDIETIVLFVAEVLNGLASREDFPYEIPEKYNKAAKLKTCEELDENDYELLSELAEVKQDIKVKKARETEIANYIKANFNDTKIKTDRFTCTVSTSKGRASLDTARLSIERPDVDLSQYQKVSAGYKTIRISGVK